jgi:hypothetical protein
MDGLRCAWSGASAARAFTFYKLRHGRLEQTGRRGLNGFEWMIVGGVDGRQGSGRGEMRSLGTGTSVVWDAVGGRVLGSLAF